MTYEESYQLFSIEAYNPEKYDNKEDYKKYLFEQINTFFYENYRKKPEILNNAFDVLGFKYLLEKEDNSNIIHKLLADNIFLKYFQENNFGVIHLVFILWVFNDTSERNIQIIKQDKLKREKFLNDSIKKFNNFIEHKDEINNFKSWYKNEVENNLANMYVSVISRLAKTDFERELCYKLIVENTTSEYLSNIDLLFGRYVEEIYYKNINYDQFVSGERNIAINKFIRDLWSLFKIDNVILKNSFFIYVISIIYDRHLEETQISNILEKSNISAAISEFKLSFLIDVDNVQVHVKIERGIS